MFTNKIILEFHTFTLLFLLLVPRFSSASNEKMKCAENFGEERAASGASSSDTKKSSVRESSESFIQKAIWQYKALVLEVTHIKQSSSASSSSIAALNSEVASRKSGLLKAGVPEKPLLLTQEDREYLTSEIAKRTHDAEVKESDSELQTQLIETNKKFKEWVIDKSYFGKGTYREFSPDGKFMATSGELMDLSTGKKKKLKFSDGSYAQAGRFSPDSRLLATGSTSGKIYLWEVPSGKFIKELTGLESVIIRFEYSPDGRFLIVNSYDEDASIWNISSGDVVVKDVFNWANQIYFSPDGAKLAIIDSTIAKVSVLKTHTLEVDKELKAGYFVVSIVFSGDGKRIATAEANKTIKIWDADTYELKREFVISGDSQISQMLANRDRFIIGLSDGSVREYKFSSGKEKVLISQDRELVDRVVQTKKYSLSPKLLNLSTTADGRTLFLNWDLGSNKATKQFETRRWTLKSILR